ncbi:MAG: hypothetical protein GY856_41895, partial [bacterium]|nr:hypothetical protein [bacterium]
KISVWRDGLYYSHNDFDSGPGFTLLSAVAIAFDKAAMYAGDPAAVGIKFQLFPQPDRFPFYLLASHWEGNKKPELGAPNIYWQAFDEQVFGDGSGVDGYRQWAFSADFADPLSSTFVELPRIPAPPFNMVLPCGRNCFDQPPPGTVAEGHGLDDIGLRAMYRAQWRSFGQYDSVLINMTVNADGAGTGGIRWVELRDFGNGFQLFQTSTFA